VNAEQVWEGPDEYRPFLIPIDILEPFPGNPRRGNVEAVQASLERFGQAKLSVVRDGDRVIAGHHVIEAARNLGWTHVAAPPMPFKDEDEQRAFLLADNRTSDLGAYDDELLVQQLRVLAEIDALDGTGYTYDDLDALLARVVEVQAHDRSAPTPPDDPDPAALTDTVEVVLVFSKQQRDDLERWLATIAEQAGTTGVSETVYAAARYAAGSMTAQTPEPVTPA
jgi:hypothetical protein